MIEHQRRPRSAMFSGPVIDGPFAGDWISYDAPFYEALFLHHRIGVFSYSDLSPNSGIEVDRAFYKWIHGYGAWAHVQPYRRSKS